MTQRERAIPEAFCEGKAKMTRTRAREVAKRMRRRNRGRCTAQTFKCPRCKCWHIGNGKYS